MMGSKFALAALVTVSLGFLACGDGGQDVSLVTQFDDQDEPDTKSPAPVTPDPKEEEPAPTAPPGCDATKPFGDPVPVAINSALWDTGPRLSPDELTLYYSRTDDPPVRHVYAARRSSFFAAFGDPQRVEGFGEESTGYLTITADGLSGFVSSTRAGSEGIDVFRVARSSPTGAWESLVALPSLARPAGAPATLADDNPFVTPNGATLYYDSRRATGFDDFDIFRATVSASGEVSAPMSLGATINTAADEENAVLSPDELTLYFARRTVEGKQDVFVATRPTTGDDWGAATAVTELNTVENDRPGWISADGCRMYISSERAGGAGLSDIFVATRPL